MPNSSYSSNVFAKRQPFRFRQGYLLLHVTTRLDIQFAYIEPQCLKTKTCEFDGVATLEAAQIGDAQLPLIAGKCRIKDAFCRQEPRMHVHRIADVRLGKRTII